MGDSEQSNTADNIEIQSENAISIARLSLLEESDTSLEIVKSNAQSAESTEVDFGSIYVPNRSLHERSGSGSSQFQALSPLSVDATNIASSDKHDMYLAGDDISIGDESIDSNVDTAVGEIRPTLLLHSKSRGDGLDRNYSAVVPKSDKIDKKRGQLIRKGKWSHSDFYLATDILAFTPKRRESANLKAARLSARRSAGENLQTTQMVEEALSSFSNSFAEEHLILANIILPNGMLAPNKFDYLLEIEKQAFRHIGILESVYKLMPSGSAGASGFDKRLRARAVSKWRQKLRHFASNEFIRCGESREGFARHRMARVSGYLPYHAWPKTTAVRCAMADCESGDLAQLSYYFHCTHVDMTCDSFVCKTCVHECRPHWSVYRYKIAARKKPGSQHSGTNTDTEAESGIRTEANTNDHPTCIKSCVGVCQKTICPPCYAKVLYSVFSSREYAKIMGDDKKVAKLVNWTVKRSQLQGASQYKPYFVNSQDNPNGRQLFSSKYKKSGHSLYGYGHSASSILTRVAKKDNVLSQNKLAPLMTKSNHRKEKFAFFADEESGESTGTQDPMAHAAGEGGVESQGKSHKSPSPGAFTFSEASSNRSPLSLSAADMSAPLLNHNSGAANPRGAQHSDDNNPPVSSDEPSARARKFERLLHIQEAVMQHPETFYPYLDAYSVCGIPPEVGNEVEKAMEVAIAIFLGFVQIGVPLVLIYNISLHGIDAHAETQLTSIAAAIPTDCANWAADYVLQTEYPLGTYSYFYSCATGGDSASCTQWTCDFHLDRSVCSKP
jgi:hypothetical protein